jgi:hypothetical protein
MNTEILVSWTVSRRSSIQFLGDFWWCG